MHATRVLCFVLLGMLIIATGWAAPAKGGSWLATGTVMKLDGNTVYFLGRDNAVYLIDTSRTVMLSNTSSTDVEPRPGDLVRVFGCTTRAGEVKADRIAGIGLSGQMHGSVFLDRENKVIRPAILWCDQRTGAEVKEIEKLVGKKRINQITGNPVFTGFTAPKILWLRKNEPDAYRKITKILLPKDYLRYRLTGEFASEVTDNSGTSLFDVETRKWSPEILKKLQIKPDWLAPVFESPDITGKVTAEAAGLTGLPEGIPVVAGASDQAASGCGNGVVSQGIISTTLGTSGVVFAFSDKVLKDSAGRIHTMCHAVPGTWHLMAVSLSSGGSLRWFRDTFCREEISEAKIKHKDPYEIMTAAAAKISAGS